MAWTHLKKNSGMGHDEQWLYKIGTAPVCSLKKDETLTSWCASLLHLNGHSATIMHVVANSLEQAQRQCEKELDRIGWKEEDNANISQTI